MTKRKDKDEGFQIPIEGADDQAAEEAVEPANSAEPAAKAEEASAPAEADAAEADAAAKEDDIVAEAEAILEDAESEIDELEKAKQEASEWQDRYLRLHAEWDTYRRRTNEQRAEEKQRAAEKLVENLLPVLDDFERSIDYAVKNGETGLLDGIRAVQTKLVDVLGKHGMEVIDPAGQAFDALEAQAVGTVPDDSVYDETVHDVYQKGYRMGKKVLRPAMVTITTGGPARPKDDETEA